MTAIFGVLGPASAEEIKAMAARLSHKGTHTYHWSPEPNVCLGEIRHSPRKGDEDELTAFSGQLYLDWRNCGTVGDNSDSSGRDHQQRLIASRAARKDPIGFAKGLDGYFGIACWDPANRRLILTVDRLRYERIYYTEVSGRFVFASEYKALLALADVEAVPDPDSIQYSIATVFPNTGRTLCRGIETVLPGHALIVSGKKRDLMRYFEPQCVPARGNLEHFANGLRQALVDDVQALLSRHERVALTLSGGLDSAGLLGVIRHTMPDATIAAYTIAADVDDPELSGARRAAQYFNVEHNQYIFDPLSITSDLPKIVWLAEEFASREESVLQYQLESLILRNEPVLVNGRGADAALAGMPRNRLVRMAETLPFVSTAMTEIYQQTQSGAPPSSALGRFGSRLLYRGTAIEPPQVSGASGSARVYEPNDIADARTQGMRSNNSNQHHSAVASMSPTEIVMPFMSRNVMEYCMTIPSRHVIGLRKQKIVLRQALTPFLPNDIRNRGKSVQRAKRNTALSDSVDSLATAFLNTEALEMRGLLDPDYVARLRKRPSDGIYRGDQLTRLWMLIIVEIWCRTFIDQRGEPVGFSRDDLWATAPTRL